MIYIISYILYIYICHIRYFSPPELKKLAFITQQMKMSQSTEKWNSQMKMIFGMRNHLHLKCLQVIFQVIYFSTAASICQSQYFFADQVHSSHYPKLAIIDQVHAKSLSQYFLFLTINLLLYSCRRELVPPKLLHVLQTILLFIFTYCDKCDLICMCISSNKFTTRIIILPSLT